MYHVVHVMPTAVVERAFRLHLSVPQTSTITEMLLFYLSFHATSSYLVCNVRMACRFAMLISIVKMALPSLQLNSTVVFGDRYNY